MWSPRMVGDRSKTKSKESQVTMCNHFITGLLMRIQMKGTPSGEDGSRGTKAGLH